VIVGAGFGGLQCARKLAGEPVDVVLVDRQNYHLFTPLLYQVASCLLSPSDIAAPLRKVFRRAPNVRVRLGEAVDVDFAGSRAARDGDTLEYDELVLGRPARTSSGMTRSPSTLGLKDLGKRSSCATTCSSSWSGPAHSGRRRTPAPLDVLHRRRRSDRRRVRGCAAELVRLVLPQEYPELSASEVRIILLEGGDRLLPTFKPKLSVRASRARTARVTVRLNSMVASATRQSRAHQGRARDRDPLDDLDRRREAERSSPPPRPGRTHGRSA
jgi:NADH dehydrogenase